MSDTWENVDVWKRVGGRNQMRRFFLGNEEWVEIKFKGDVLRLRLSDLGHAPYDPDGGDGAESENPVHFGSIDLNDEYEDPKVKVREPNGDVSPWMPVGPPMTMTNVVATKARKKQGGQQIIGTNPEPMLQPGQYVCQAHMMEDGTLMNIIQDGGPVYP